MAAIDPNQMFRVFEAWLRTWEDLLKKPGDILLERSFLNIIPPALMELRRAYLNNKKIERSAIGWGRVLLGLLEEDSDSDNSEIEFLRSEYPTEIANLKHLLKEGKFDAGRIFPLLESIAPGPSVRSIFESLRVEFQRGVDADFDRIVIGSTLILRNALTRYSVSTLKEKLHLSVARYGSHLSVGKLLSEIQQDDVLIARITASWNSFIVSAASRASTPKADSDAPFCKMFGLYSWELKARVILSRTGEFLAEQVKQKRQTASGITTLTFTDTDQQTVGMFLAREYAAAYLRQLFELPMAGPAQRQGEHLSAIGQSLGDFLLSNGFADKRSGSDHRPNPVDSCCTEAFVRLIKTIAERKTVAKINDKTIALHARGRHRSILERMKEALVRFIKIIAGRKLAAKIDDRSTALSARELGSTILERMRSYASFQELKWETSSDEEIETACRYFLTDLSVQQDLTKLLAFFNPSLEISFKKLLADHTFISFPNWLAEAGFWEKWCANFLLMPTWEKGIFYYLPWETFQQPDIEQLLTKVSADFEVSNKNFLVVFTIKNLHPPRLPRTIAKVTFYDPYQWNFGEQFWREEKNKGNHTSAMIEVDASTFLEAKRKGMSHLMELLNCMSLSLSINRNWGGFKPAVDSEIFAKNMSNGDWSINQALVRVDRPITQSFEHFQKFGPMFDFIIEASRSASATMLQTKLLRALHWYSYARWEPDPAQSFLFYWIGLEHLFDEDEGDMLLDLIAKLHVNWRDVLKHGWYFLTRHAGEVLKQLRADDEIVEMLRHHQSLSEWQRDRRVLLNYGNVQALQNLIPQQKKELKDYVRGYAEYLENFSKDAPSIIRAMHSLRDDLQFRLLTLKHIRNDIVHQALIYEANMSLYTDELEEIFEESIVKLTNDAIRQIPECASIKDLITLYEEMWIS